MELAVAFDFDHTLGVDNRLERKVALAMLAELASAAGAVVDDDRASAAIESTLHSYRHGLVSVEDGMASFFAEFLPDHTIETVDAASRFRDRVTDQAKDCVEPVAGALEMLAALDAMGIRYALLTNGWSPLQEAKARMIGFKGGVFVSERIGARKPAPEAFDMLVQHFELPPEQIWYVGDDPEPDIGGAIASGLPCVWFDWEGRRYPPSLPPPTHTVHSLSELPALFQGQLAEMSKRA